MQKSQLRFTAALAALVLLVVCVSGALAQRRLRQRELARIDETLSQHAALVRELAAGVPFSPDHTAELDAIADRAGAASGVRVTLIAADGAVLGDSEVPGERLRQVESHATRPEVIEALAGRVGRGERRSGTVGREFAYVAVPAARVGGGVVRVARDLSSLHAELAAQRSDLVASGAVGLLAAVVLSYALSWVALRPLRELRGVAASIAAGDLRALPPLRARDELGDIADAIHRLAGQLRERLDDATREKEQLQAVLDGMVEGVIVVDAEGRILLANRQLREIFDAWGEIPGRLPIEAVRDAELDAILRRARESDEAVSGMIRRGPGGRRTLDVHAVRFPPRGGPRLGTVAVLHDVSELTRLEKVRRDFVANASHELRTPLSAIRGFSETLLSSDDLSESDRRSYLEIIDRHSHRLGNIVADLLELSELESGTARLELGTVDVAALAQTLIQDSHNRFVEKQLDVSLHAKGETHARTDALAVEQILTNLLANAVQYTDVGGSIEVQVEGSERIVAVSVVDTGIGIPEEDRDRIFERFYRVDKARSRALGGTGLGLAIVKHRVQSLGGEIRVTSELGRGSTFRFTLPAASSARS